MITLVQNKLFLKFCKNEYRQCMNSFIYRETSPKLNLFEKNTHHLDHTQDVFSIPLPYLVILDSCLKKVSLYLKPQIEFVL